MSPADSPFAQLPAPGPHPAPAELRAYAAGTLAPAQEHRIEAHALDCARCADVLDGFAMTDAATTDQAVAGLRTRLHARIGHPAAEPAATGWAWPRIAAAAALVGVVGGGLWGWEQRAPAPKPETARLETSAPAASKQVAAPAPATTDIASRTSATATTEPEASPATRAASAAKPQVRHPEYAAAAPSQVARRHRVSARQAPTAASAGYAVLVDAASAPASSTVVDAVTEAKEPAGTADAAVADVEISASVKKMAVPTASKGEAAFATPAVADSVTSDRKNLAANSLNEARIAINSLAADNTAAASVPNTPMPAAFAIKPIPVGGTSALRDYIRRQAAEFEPGEGAKRIHGVVRLTFTVGADGKVSNLKVVRSMRADYDDEALRMVCEGPAWQPGIAAGRRTPLPIELTVTF